MIKNRITAILLLCTFILTLIPFAGAVTVSANDVLSLEDGKLIIMDFGNTDEIPESVLSHSVAEVTEEVAFEGKASSVKYTMNKTGTADLDVVISTSDTDLGIFESANATINVRFFSESAGSKFNVMYFNTGNSKSYYPNPVLSRPSIEGGWQIFSLPFDSVYAKTGNDISLKINDDGWANTANFANGDTVYIDSVWIEMKNYGSKTLLSPESSIPNGAENQATNLDGNNTFTLTFDENLWQHSYTEDNSLLNPADAVSVYEYDPALKTYVLTEQSYTIDITSNVLSVIFDSEVADNTGYKVTVDSDVLLSASGKKLSGDLSYEFAVGTGSSIFTLAGTSLRNGAMEIDDFSPDYEYVFTFNHEIDDTDISLKITVLENNADITEDCAIKARGNEMAVVFPMGLAKGSTYNIILNPDITDKNGLALEADVLTFSFSTSYGIADPVLNDGKIVVLDFGNPDILPKPLADNPNMKSGSTVCYEGKGSSLEWTLTSGAMSEADFMLNTSGINLSALKNATVNLRFYSEAVGSKFNVTYRNPSTGSYHPDAARTRPEVSGGWQIFSLPFNDVYARTGNSIALRLNNTGWNNSGNFTHGDKIYIDSVWLEMADYGDATLGQPSSVLANGSENISTSLEGNNDFNMVFSEGLWQYPRVENGDVINFADGVSVYEYDVDSKQYIPTSQGYTIQINGNTLSVVFDGELTDKTNYRITVDSEYIVSYSGKKPVSDIDYALAVGTVSMAFSVSATSISDGAVAENVDNYEFTFNHEPAPELDPAQYISLYRDGVKVYNSFTAVRDGKKVRVEFTNPLEAGSTYALKINKKYSDIYGNTFVGDNEYRFSIPAVEVSDDVFTVFSVNSGKELPVTLEASTEYPNLYDHTAKIEVPRYENSASMREVNFIHLNRFNVDEMKYLNLWMYVSEGAKGAANIVLKMDTQNNKYVLYRQQFSGKGWELVSIPLSVITSERSFDTFMINFNGWVSAGTTWQSDAVVCFDEIWFSKEEPKNLKVESSSFANNFSNAAVSGQILELRFTTPLHDRQSPAITFTDESGEACDDYEVTYSGNTMTFRFGELKPSTTYSLNVDGLIAKQPVKQEKPVSITFTTQNGGVYLNGISQSGKNIAFDVNALTASELEFVIYASGEDNELLLKKSEIHTVSDKEIVNIEFLQPEDTYEINAFVLDKKGRLISGKYASINSDMSEMITASAPDGSNPEITVKSELDVKILKITATLSGVSDAAFVKITAPDGKSVSEKIASASSDGKLVYYFVFSDELLSGKYSINITSDTTSVSETLGYLSSADRNDLVSLSTGNDEKKLSEFIDKNAESLGMDDVSAEMADDIAFVVTSSENTDAYSDILTLIKSLDNFTASVNKATWSELAALIDKNSNMLSAFDYEPIRDFDELSDNAANEVCAKLRKKLPAKSITDLVGKLKSAIDEYEKSLDKNSGGGSGSGGSGGKVTSAGSFPMSQPQVATPQAFNDIQSVSWAYDSIMKLFDEGIVSASSDGRFRPDDNITREEFVKLIVCAFAPDAEASSHKFTDATENAWYNEYISKAYALGIVTGYPDGSFGVGENISREDMVTVIARALEALGNSFENSTSMTFSDKDEISAYAYDYVEALTSLGVINGMGNGTFAPKSTATRAQAAKVIASLIDIY